MSDPRPIRPDPMVHESGPNRVLLVAFAVLLFATLMILFVDIALMAGGR